MSEYVPVKEEFQEEFQVNDSAVSVLDWNRVSKIYHVARQPLSSTPLYSELLEYRNSSEEKWTSAHMALFGVREWCRGVLPTISPHGYSRAILPVTSVLQHHDDYLLPLKEDSHSRLGRMDQSIYCPGNYHFEFLYVTAEHMERCWKGIPLELQSWYDQWKLNDHPYIQMGNGTSLLKYAEIRCKRVWYDILVPWQYGIEFGEGTKFDSVQDTMKWGIRNSMKGVRSVTEIGTAALLFQNVESDPPLSM